MTSQAAAHPLTSFDATADYLADLFAGTEGDIVIGAAKGEIATRECDEIEAFIKHHPDADVQLVTRKGGKDAELAGIGARLQGGKEVEDLPLPPSVVLRKDPNTPEQKTYVIYLLAEAADLLGSTCDALEALKRRLEDKTAELTDPVPLAGVDGWEIVGEMGASYTVERIVKAFTKPVEGGDLEGLKSGEALDYSRLMGGDLARPKLKLSKDAYEIHAKRSKVEDSLDFVDAPVFPNRAAPDEPRPSGSSEARPYGDGVMYGELSDDLKAKPISVCRGGSTHDRVWNEVKGATWGHLVEWFSSHPVGKAKDGDAIVGASLVNRTRQAKAVRHCSLIMFDSDTGQSLEEIVAKVREMGTAAIIYTTWSHNKNISEISEGNAYKYGRLHPELLDATGEPTTELLVKILIEEKKIRPEILEGAEYIGKELLDKGNHCMIRHQPMPRFRVIMPLKEPFSFTSRGKPQAAAIKEWGERYAAVSEAFGVFYDKACVDPCRLMYTPRHRKGAPFQTVIVAGEPLDIEKFEPVSKGAQSAKVGEPANPFTAAALDMLGEDPSKTGSKSSNQYATPWLKAFAARFTDKFEPVDFLRVHGEEGEERHTNGSWVCFKCPRDHHHSNEDDAKDVAFVAMNASDADGVGFQMTCRHGSCADPVDRLSHLDEIIVAKGLTKKDLQEFCLDLDEEDEDWFAGRVGTGSGDRGSRDGGAGKPPLGGSVGGGGVIDPVDQWPLPEGYGILSYVNRGRLRWWVYEQKKREKSEETYEVPLCTAFRIEGETINPNQEYGVRVTIALKRGKLATVDLSGPETVDKQAAIKKLRAAGMEFTAEGEKFVVSCLKAPNIDRDIKIVEQPGWFGLDTDEPSFLLPTGEKVGDADVELWRDACIDAAKNVAGTYEGWKDAVDAALRSGVPHFQIAVLTGCVGPLPPILDLDSMVIAYTQGCSALRMGG